MPDPILPTPSTTPNTPVPPVLVSPQDMVDAALSGDTPKTESLPPLTPLTQEPITPNPVPEPIAPVIEPTPTLPVSPISPVSMGDDTPLAFAAMPTPVASAPVNTELPPNIRPTPSEPMPKPKNKIRTLIVGLLLVIGMVGGVYGYTKLNQKPAQVAKIANEACGAGFHLVGSRCVQDSNTGGGGGTGGTGTIETNNEGASDKTNSGGGGGGGNTNQCNPNNADGNGGCGANEGCSCSNKDEISNGTFTSCKCGPTGNQDTCFHTICPINYECKQGTSGVDAYCVPKTKPSEPPEDQTHHVCNTTTYACVVVDGPGADTCTTEAQCAPNPTMACTGLTSTPATVPAPVIGSKLTFTCAGTITPSTAGTLSYKFQYSINGGAPLTLAPLTATPNKTELTINACGSYKVQCKACATLNGVLTCDPDWAAVK